jgi:ATP-dependent exoDNAse (exonuclease V) beta subunit
MQVRTKSVPSMLRMRSVWRNSSPTSQSVETAEELIRRYQVQLDYYAKALSQLTGLEVKEKLIYSFTLGREINVGS